MGRNTIINLYIKTKEETEKHIEKLEDFIVDLTGLDIDIEQYDYEAYYNGELYNGHRMGQFIKELLDEKDYRDYLIVKYGWVDIDDIPTEEL